MPHFPMFIDLKGRPVLIIGGGPVALRKIQKLQPYGPSITLIAPEILPEIEMIPNICLICRSFREEDLLPRPDMVIAATNDQDLNSKISSLCHAQNIPVNVVDDPARCSFLFPALVQRGSFSAGICTGGASPTAAAYYKERLQEQLPDDLDAILSWLEQQRPALKAAIPDQRRRAAIFRQLFDACLKKGGPLSEAEVREWAEPSPLGSVALVGAGCGKADLITLRGLRLLQNCQAVVYDDLIDPALLDAAPESALRIYMGKRSGVHSAPQAQINQTLVDLARQGLQVVRLKGGDPYLFGRGGEEMLALRAAGIPCQEVPGIPSAIGIPAEAGIPVTHRGASRGLHIVTAHTSDTEDGLPADFDQLANLSDTLVFLMGLKQLPKISARLIAAGKSGDTPAAILSGGNSPNPAIVRAPLSRLPQVAEESQVQSPAIILIGEVAAMDLVSKPLSGIRVGVTGTAQVAQKQLSTLEALGASVSWVSRTEVTARSGIDLSPLKNSPGWLVFTSPNGVRVFFDIVKENLDPILKDKKFAVIGAATGEALARHGITADLCPKEFTSEALANTLTASADPGAPLFLLRSAIGSPVLPQILKAAGHDPIEIPLYDLQEVEPLQPLPKLDYLTFSSASGVDTFLRRHGAISPETTCICIGPVTADVLIPHTDAPVLIASSTSAAGIAEAILNHHAKKEIP